jgi:uncharacterized protein YraI
MKRLLYCIGSSCLFAPMLAQATDGYLVSDINLQAGPDTAYPSVALLTTGTPVKVLGCTSSWSWCDVVAGANRGWVAGTFLQEDYRHERVVVAEYGPRLDIPVAKFSLSQYWDEHYRERPWYAQRTKWESQATPSSPVPSPAQIRYDATSQAAFRSARAHDAAKKDDSGGHDEHPGDSKDR